MTVNLPLLLFGLLSLWFPRQWMRVGVTLGPGRRRSGGGRRNEEPWAHHAVGDPRVSFREFAKIRNYFDLLRATAGGLAIIGGLEVPPSISLADGPTRIPAWELMAIKLGVVCVGLLIQTLRYERHRVAFFAPIFYLAGLTISFCSPMGALFAFLLVWAMNPTLAGAQAFLSLYSLLALGFGLLLIHGSKLLPVAAFVFCFLPVLLSLLARRPLVVFTRKAVPAAGAGA